MKFAVAVLLILFPAIGALALQPTELSSPVSSTTTSPAISALFAGADSNGSVSAASTLAPSIAAAPHIDLSMVGACAALASCCLLGLAMLRRHSRGGSPTQRAALVGQAMFPSTNRPAQSATPMRPSLLHLSVSRT